MPPLLYNHILRTDPNYQRNFWLLATAATTSRPNETSPAQMLQGQAVPILNRVRAFLKPEWRRYNYKVTMNLCSGAEHVVVEALHLGGGVANNLPEGENGATNVEGFGCLHSMTMLNHVALEHWMNESGIADVVNDDDTFLSETQLRERFYQHMRQEFCISPNCHGKCAALPGDTVFWIPQEDYGRRYTRFEPATQDELVERGYMDAKGNGRLLGHARSIRQEQGNLEDLSEF